jgi:AcrR family transcriptional regulator
MSSLDVNTVDTMVDSATLSAHDAAVTQRPGPAAGRLSRETILDAYIRLADREGPQAVSLRRLGAELGVDATAVYRHFRDKEALLEAVADRLLSELADRVPRTDDWRRDLHELGIRARAMYLGHPRLARVIAMSPEPLTGNVRLTEYVLDRLRLAGCSVEDAARIYETLAAFVAGGSSLDAEAGTASNAALRRHLAALDAAAYPETVVAASYMLGEDDASFRFGLDLFLDGIAARIGDGGTPISD